MDGPEAAHDAGMTEKRVTKRNGSPNTRKDKDEVMYNAQPSAAVSGTYHQKKITESMLNRLRNSSSGALRELK
jgi:hypothetical protein